MLKSRKQKLKGAEVIEVSKKTEIVLTIFLVILMLLFLIPIFLIFMNSFKSKLYISDIPFAMPTTETFVGLSNYISGIGKTGFINAFLNTAIITVLSVSAIILFTSMTAWWLTRVKGIYSSILYYLFVFAMIVPFQMVMFPLAKITDTLHFNTPIKIIFVYVGFGAGLSVFMFAGFVKSIPISLEEAALIDGCNPIQTFFRIICPVLKPTIITVAILNAMWVWNDYLLPVLVLRSDYQTIPIAVQYLRGGYGSIDMGAMMAMLVLAIVPVIVFYLFCQKYIIKGVAAGAVKG
ncbi:carbohydrate ABC transporter permease [Kineothrix sp. MB12-C1]|uniref:carbohydrate ABC transporter permease n=1 Tax=Kineothrix sp. MB12-C1 TaxID=3070215 RepID=UPI0027D315B5|nr:carbohydrate ABC transporter permease [Kineothrix sp. MB12-C1]WMC91982.1 carbohydrate ABC transporter permease [Kineothrix sp. MB12-C1]